MWALIACLALAAAGADDGANACDAGEESSCSLLQLRAAPVALAGSPRASQALDDAVHGRSFLFSMAEASAQGRLGDLPTLPANVALVAAEAQNGSAAPPLRAERFAPFLVWGVGSQPVAKSVDEFAQRIVAGRRYWGAHLNLFTAVVELSNNSQEALSASGCTPNATAHSAESGSSFQEWLCVPSDAGVEPFAAVLVPCNGSYLDYPSFSCKWDKIVDYAFNARPSTFADVDWMAIGDDDIGYVMPTLLNFLGHYDGRGEPIVLNPAARDLKEQRSGSGPTWNKAVRACNPNIPERFMGSVYARGLLERTKGDHAAGAMQRLSESFKGAQDTVQGLLWWMHGAKFLPLGRDEPDTNDSAHYKADVLMAHRVRSPAMQADLARLGTGPPVPDPKYPEAEPLAGVAYSGHGAAGALRPEDCGTTVGP